MISYISGIIDEYQLNKINTRWDEIKLDSIKYDKAETVNQINN